MVVGRAEECHLQCPGDTVSPMHLALQRVESNYDRHIYWDICDTSDDTVGTFVNGSRIPKGRPVRLNDQDVIAVLTVDAVMDKRTLFRYLVVAPKGLFPDPDSDDNTSDDNDLDDNTSEDLPDRVEKLRKLVKAHWIATETQNEGQGKDGKPNEDK